VLALMQREVDRIALPDPAQRGDRVGDELLYRRRALPRIGQIAHGDGATVLGQTQL
jgi:hypothetical protein